MHTVVCPSVRKKARPARMSGARPTDLCGLLRHQAAGRDRLPVRLRLSRQRPRASAGGRRAAAAARRRAARAAACATSASGKSQLFFLIATFLVRYEPPELQPLIDDDVAEAAAALAATFETASRGVIYEHRAASCRPSGCRRRSSRCSRRRDAGVGSAFERDAAVVLRRSSDARADVRAVEPGESPRVPRAARPRRHRVRRRTTAHRRQRGAAASRRA